LVSRLEDGGFYGGVLGLGIRLVASIKKENQPFWGLAAIWVIAVSSKNVKVLFPQVLVQNIFVLVLKAHIIMI